MNGWYIGEVVTHEQIEPKHFFLYKKPRQYKVTLLNDDYTPMDFVVDVIKHFFHKNESIAVQLMLQVHYQGRAICGIFSRDIAETKVGLVNDHARNYGYPLLCRMEPE